LALIQSLPLKLWFLVELAARKLLATPLPKQSNRPHCVWRDAHVSVRIVEHRREGQFTGAIAAAIIGIVVDAPAALLIPLNAVASLGMRYRLRAGGP
jgi:hypothetical protein